MPVAVAAPYTVMSLPETVTSLSGPDTSPVSPLLSETSPVSPLLPLLSETSPVPLLSPLSPEPSETSPVLPLPPFSPESPGILPVSSEPEMSPVLPVPSSACPASAPCSVSFSTVTKLTSLSAASAMYGVCVNTIAAVKTAASIRVPFIFFFAILCIAPFAAVISLFQHHLRHYPPEEGSGADVEFHGFCSAVFSASLQGNLRGSLVYIVLIADNPVTVCLAVFVRDER